MQCGLIKVRSGYRSIVHACLLGLTYPDGSASVIPKSIVAAAAASSSISDRLAGFLLLLSLLSVRSFTHRDQELDLAVGNQT